MCWETVSWERVGWKGGQEEVLDPPNIPSQSTDTQDVCQSNKEADRTCGDDFLLGFDTCPRL